MPNVLTMNHLKNRTIMKLLKRAGEFERGEQHPMTGTIVNLFYEPSTRTKMSFEMAEHRMGLTVLPFETAFSSVQKGETLYDTVKTFESIGVDGIVIRHEEEAYYEELKGCNVAIINGGDGSGQHPTQSLLDLYTIHQEFGRFEGIHVTIVGDIAHSRVAKSNAAALKQLGAEVSFVCPEEWSGGYETSQNLDELLPDTDVVMMLRVQHERHAVSALFSKENYHKQFGLTVERERKMKNTAIIMHPAPINRGVEIADSLVECERSRIFKQMANGVFVRMAVLEYALKGRD
ncbi:aspartate carbamoyltransferase catalytic subunit [Planococcus glaciei]|uniref:Aspartate carbamoyltransferase n=1 Tax=Planococcus glaciei TaxID=459472 RepID=A0A7H8Q6J3_9BACL|nr:aspartate carbamoyltransferase catalytic subunit [Planococcus glaciei]ETP68653.1 aspartate carbamoyltransferase [Planococcus glaciei CHR43]KOF10348.1 aspartate carbamoyltransferase catalytic subunit [Planococcus glaciei]QDY44558.1 aspartate carbamoyltransferase catalytic subunit [Planococcus glaciei]QKX49161.1 aspartate carbamoyltransferase catalytic subunit [Planococcus glaciei]